MQQEEELRVEDEASGPSVLHIVARRVRSVRAMRGISRKILAERARVSVRHLAQIEQGTGNVSIKLLEQIADALGVSPAELVSSTSSAEHAILGELIATLSPSECREAETLIRRHLLIRTCSRPEVVSLIGLRGAGKSTLGRRLADIRGVPFISITELIESTAGMRVAEINSLSGQKGYRRYESQAVEQALAYEGGAVIEAGGSIVSNGQAFNALLNESFVVWIQASPEEHMARVIEQGDLRPIEGRCDAMDDLTAMLEERAPMYSRAHAQLDTSDSDPDTSLAALVEITGLKEGP